MARKKPGFFIKQISQNDLIKLSEISKDTFVETFAEQNTVENLNLYLSINLSIEVLRNEMNSERSKFYFAYYGTDLAGYLKLNFSKTPNELEIERIYVLKKFQGKKIGLAMMNKAFEYINTMQISRIWLGVWEHNLKAIFFYSGLGFQKNGEQTFLLGNDIQRDLIMEIIL